MILIRQYATTSGRNVFKSWLESLPNRQVQARIAARLERLTAGNFGDCKAVGGSVSELRIHHGPGYRVYFAMVERECVLLLCGGEKRRQSADIATAIEYLKDYKLRSAKT